ncbi:4-hydroxybutyrate coenzyme A transferase [Neodiprion virginianus]|uniref:4-hydroxybutyrate coenzyme A transferase n=1 Tax=Neodiprion virginianus TaxID=2961670 RepID=UPI001EE6E65E|nr:4-hydroxybutyrate coenzyme A transferase [Neodiprion virginianus]
MAAALKRVACLTRTLTASWPARCQASKSYFTYSMEPGMPIPDKQPVWTSTADEAMEKACIKSDDLVFAQGAAATPLELLRALTNYGVCQNLENVKIVHMHLEGEAPFAQPEVAKHFRSMSVFMGGNVRAAVNEGRADSIPIFLHEIPKLFMQKILRPRAALIHVSAPDSRGYCSLGTSVDSVRSALVNSEIIIAQVNKHMPRTFGDALIHQSHFDYAVEHHTPLPTHGGKPPSKVESQIGQLIADNLVENGATLQMGIGSIPDAVLSALKGHKDLGVHSEMFSDGVVDLVNTGCITNNKKIRHQGRIVGSFCVGTQKLYDFMHNNPFIEMLVVNYVNDPHIVSLQPKMTAINSCIEVDITGQVCSDSIGTRMYSGFGGQVDFIRGAAMGKDGMGKAIIALPSVTNKGVSKIQPVLKLGAGVVTTRAHVRYVVTEHGIASLFGKTLRQRAHALINIAHPDHRESLEKSAFERLKCMPCP